MAKRGLSPISRTILALITLSLVMLSSCTQSPTVTTFSECVEAGNPIMESYPRQCRHADQTFIEELDEPIEHERLELTPCEDPRPEICTREYRPVCALVDNGVRCVTTPCASTDAITKATGCVACSEQDVLAYYPQSCEQNRFVICETSFTGFNITQIAQENGWICTDICPGNYDEYTTQIGARMCIEHYGEDAIESWETCEQSTETCDCVNAYETTTGDAYEGGYRCVPEHYAERMIFRAGIDRLDENGERSVVIA